MTADQLRRREGLMGRLDAIVALAPGPSFDAAAREHAEVVAQLESLAKEADLTDGDVVQRSRTWRFVGGAYFNLGSGRDPERLRSAKTALDHAEELLATADDPGERGRLDMLYGSVLRSLAGGTDLALLEQANLRYRLALEKLRDGPQELVTYIQQQQRILKQQLVLASAFGQAAAGFRKLKDIERVLTNNGAGSTPDSEQKAKRLLREFGGRDQLSKINEQATRAADSLAPVLPGATAKFKAIMDQLADLQRSKPPSADAELDLAWVPFLRDAFQRQVKEGRVKPARQQVVAPLLDELEKVVVEAPDDGASIEEHQLWMGRLHDLMLRASLLLRDASYAVAVPAGSRAKILLSFVEAQAKLMAQELTRSNLPEEERRVGNALLARLAEVGTNMSATAGNDAAAIDIEREAFRQACLDVRRFVRRRHLTMAMPFWGPPPPVMNPNAVFFAGTAARRDVVAQACRTRGLELLDRNAGKEIGRGRWQDLATSAIAIFDLTAPPGPELAAVCYDLGLSQSLGIVPIVLSRDGLKSPFDVNVYEYRLDGAHDEEIVGGAIDDALYGLPQRDDGSSVKATVTEVHGRFSAGSSAEAGSRVLLQQTLEALAGTDDTIDVARLIERLPGGDSVSVLFPAWPGAYAPPGTKRCFHVMPFGEPWSKVAMSAVQAACKNRAAYVRGDTVPNSDIIASIWNEIGVATHVVVDLTSFNPNVALELGLAHALGRKVLLVGQGDAVEKWLWPSIRKLRIEQYTLTGLLKRSIRRFLAS